MFIPAPGPQTWFVTCPVADILFGGGRGGGKTACSLYHWDRHHSMYPGAQGIFFRRRYKQLSEAIQMGRAMFGKEAKWSDAAKKFWFEWPDGSRLSFRHLETLKHAQEYQGHQYSWKCVEEGTQWPDSDLIDLLNACMRSAQGHPIRHVMTANPGGPGHGWVKDRYVTPATPNTPFVGDDGIQRIYIKSTAQDNPMLLRNDPGYFDRLRTVGAPHLVRAWLSGDWDVQAGGFLDGIWNPDIHIVEPFEVPVTWPRWRALDWGFSRPYAVGWWTMNFDGDVYLYREKYGYGGRANKGTRETAQEVAAQIVEIERPETKAGLRFMQNPADFSIFHRIGAQYSIAEHFARLGIHWSRAQHGPGSRATGINEIVQRVRSGTIKVFSNCDHWLRTVPTLCTDPENPDDVDSMAEDHMWDMTAYSLGSRRIVPLRTDGRKPNIKPFTMDWLMAQNAETGKRSKYRL